MANNRMYLKCKICGEEFMLAKSYGSGFFREDYRGNLLREFNDFLDRHTFCTCDEYQGDEGNFILAYESDPVEIEIIEQTKTTTTLKISKQIEEKPDVYECDPSKNTECKKDACFINGGECHLTTRREFQK